MKARTGANSESACNNDSFDVFTPLSSALKSAVNGDGDIEEKLGNANKRKNNYLADGLVSRKLSPTRQSYTRISDNAIAEKKLQPLHFDTHEVLEETPALLKSLNSGGRGPDTFVYMSASKPTSLSQNDDPFKTFVIASDERNDKENSANQKLAVNGIQNFAPDDRNEYLSYVIETSDCIENKKMNEKNENDNSFHRTFLGSDEADGVTNANSESKVCEFIRHREDSSLRGNCSESEICDRNVNYNIEKVAEDTTVLSFDRTITGKKEQAFAKLQDELEKAHQELKLKDEEVTRLTRIREDVERELEELTASLFQEAHKMVSIAKEKQAAAEKTLKESQMKVEVLTAEVVALKTLVLTSTPSRPNPHLHPQIGKEDSSGVNIFIRKHRRSPSHFNLKYGRENSPPESPVRDDQISVTTSLENRDFSEVDPIVHKEFMNWTLSCKLDKTDPFIDRIYREDINLCLDFSNRELAEEVQKAIETRNIFVEAVTDKSKTIFPRKCALLEVTRQCHYRMKLGDQDIWYNISRMCRNRIIAVCDFINYLRYIELGLVKSSAHDMYWEIMRLRKEMVLARLGLFQSQP